MSDLIESHRLSCPWCGRPVDLPLEWSAGSREYVEDCAVCCRPVVIPVGVNVPAGGLVKVSVSRENE